jgi:cytochrome c oxidase subunit 2
LISRNGLIAIFVVLVALVFFGFIAFRSSGSNSPTPTPTTVTQVGSQSSQADLVETGRQLYTQYRCNVCHTTNGKSAAGPTLKGLYGSQVQLNTREIVVADAEYLARSITDPDAQIVAGYGPSVMSAALDPFTTQIQQDDHVNALVAYIESLK